MTSSLIIIIRGALQALGRSVSPALGAIAFKANFIALGSAKDLIHVVAAR